jgi:hypothetical protein
MENVQTHVETDSIKIKMSATNVITLARNVLTPGLAQLVKPDTSFTEIPVSKTAQPDTSTIVQAMFVPNVTQLAMNVTVAPIMIA